MTAKEWYVLLEEAVRLRKRLKAAQARIDALEQERFNLLLDLAESDGEVWPYFEPHEADDEG